jgi:hypothetical protein
MQLGMPNRWAANSDDQCRNGHRATVDIGSEKLPDGSK